MKNMNRGIARMLAAVALLAPTLSAWAQWELDSTKSAVNFISVKNDAVAEVHSFTDLVGYVGAGGKVQLGISLGSVETMIDVRNERMQEMLFEIESFPSATVSAQVAPEIIAALVEGGTVTTDLSFTLALHGMEKTLSVPVVLIGENGERIQVFTASPVIVNAADFGLVPGIAALQQVAGLSAISTAVPVTVHLVFTRAVGPD
jgi:polyisoprenoid-binding protein YceI